MENIEIRVSIVRSGLTQKAIAEYLKISPNALSKRLHRPLAEFREVEIKNAIKEIKRRRANDNSRRTKTNVGQTTVNANE